MDEIGFRRNHHQTEYAIFNRRMGLPASIKSEKTDWTSPIECINAVGRSIRPLVIHQGTEPRQPLDEWFPPTELLGVWSREAGQHGCVMPSVHV